MDTVFQSVILQSQTETPSGFFACLIASIVLGGIMAALYQYRTDTTKSFIATYALLPAAVCAVIMMVNGNVGAGVAVAGAFSLVRFRSMPGTAREIGSIFIAMGAGLMCGMGYIAYGFCFGVILSICSLVLNRTGIGGFSRFESARQLHITIPEDLDYTGVFDTVLSKYTDEYDLVNVKTTNMGSLFKLSYEVHLKKGVSEKEMIDQVRQKNGNLEIQLTRVQTGGQL